MTTGSYNLYGFAGDGLVTEADWGRTDNLPGRFIFNINNPQFGSCLFDVTTFLQGLADSGSAYAGFIFSVDQNVRSHALVGFATSRFNSGINQPFLDVNYAPAPVPEPGTIVLLGAGLAGMFL